VKGWLRYSALTVTTAGVYAAFFATSGYWHGFFTWPVMVGGTVWLIATTVGIDEQLNLWGWHRILDRHPFKRARNRARELAQRPGEGAQSGRWGLWWGSFTPKRPGGGDRHFVQVLFLTVVHETRP
jgi:hypothetical protein